MNIFKQFLLAILLFGTGAYFQSCGLENQSQLHDISGEEEAISKVQQMMDAMGGRQNWANIASIDMDMTHYHPQTKDTINTRFWMELHTPQFRIEQTMNDSTTTILINQTEGWLGYSDTFVEKSQPEIAHRLHWYRHNLYSVLHRIASGDEFEAAIEKFEDHNRLVLYQNDHVVAWIGLDENSYPAYYSYPELDGTRLDFRYFTFQESNGHVYASSGELAHGNISFSVERWNAGNTPANITYRPE